MNAIKDDLCKHLFKKGCKSARNWEWHHQLGKTKEIQACGNIKEAFDEIKNCMCIPIPKNFHCMLHAFKPRHFYIGINYNATLFNKIARKCIYNAYYTGTVNNTILKNRLLSMEISAVAPMNFQRETTQKPISAIKLRCRIFLRQRTGEIYSLYWEYNSRISSLSSSDSSAGFPNLPQNFSFRPKYSCIFSDFSGISTPKCSSTFRARAQS